MKKFITPVSMKVTIEQYEKDLKKPLEDLGYHWGYGSHKNSLSGLIRMFNCLVSNYDKTSNQLGSQNLSGTTTHNRKYINHYNPELFLALAAMTEGDEPVVGEYMKCIDGGLHAPKPIVKTNQISIDQSFFDEGIINFRHIGGFYRKATKEELINYFTKSKTIDMKEVNNRFPFRLQQKDASRIIDVACSDWQDKLIKKWGKTLIRDGEVVIDERFYKVMREACNPTQNAVFNDIFGKDKVDNSVKVGRRDGKIRGTFTGSILVEVRSSGDYKGKSIYLNEYYNWEIKEDCHGIKVLVPTKK